MEELKVLPIRHDLVIYTSSDYESELFTIENPDGTPINLTGYQIISDAREESNKASTSIFSFVILRDNLNGAFKLSQTYTVLNAVTKQYGYYDIFLVDSLGKRKPWFFGSIVFNDVTTDTSGV